MELSKAQLHRQAYQAALDFDALRLWESFDDLVCFPVRVPRAKLFAALGLQE